MNMLRCLRASQDFRSAPRSTSKSFSRWRDKRGFLMQGATAAQHPRGRSISIRASLDCPIVKGRSPASLYSGSSL
jgi:hypothetical protein